MVIHSLFSAALPWVPCTLPSLPCPCCSTPKTFRYRYCFLPRAVLGRPYIPWQSATMLAEWAWDRTVVLGKVLTNRRTSRRQAGTDIFLAQGLSVSVGVGRLGGHLVLLSAIGWSGKSNCDCEMIARMFDCCRCLGGTALQKRLLRLRHHSDSQTLSFESILRIVNARLARKTSQTDDAIVVASALSFKNRAIKNGRTAGG